MTVYVDLLFLINFSMDFICLYVAARITSQKASALRISAAAVLGGIYSCLSLFLPLGRFFVLFCDLATGFIMCVTAFLKKGEKRLLLSFAVFFSVSMALGGIMTAIFNLLNRMGFNKAEIGQTDTDGISVWLLALLALVSALITLGGGRFFKKRAMISSIKINISYNGRSKKLCAIVDTGNLLCEPISGKPCIVIGADALRDLIEPELIMASKDKARLSLDSLDSSISKRIRLVPTRSAVGEALLIGVRMDKIIIEHKSKSFSVDAFIALSPTAGAEALVPSELI